MNMLKSRELHAKIPSQKAIFIGFSLVTVKILNSYDRNSFSTSRMIRSCSAGSMFLRISAFRSFSASAPAAASPTEARIRERSALRFLLFLLHFDGCLFIFSEGKLVRCRSGRLQRMQNSVSRLPFACLRCLGKGRLTFSPAEKQICLPTSSQLPPCFRCFPAYQEGRSPDRNGGNGRP